MYELWKTNHGIDGWDAKTTLEAVFTTLTKALQWLERRGFTHEAFGGMHFWHAEEKYRHTMGAISYEIRKANSPIIDPE
jgi:hypothetical protein